MIAAAVELFDDVLLVAAVVPSDDVSVTAAVKVPFDDVPVSAAVLPFDGELATVMPFDDVIPLTAAVVEAVFVEGNVDPGETWFLLFLVCLSQKLQS